MTSSASANNQGWALSRYDEKSLSNNKPTVTEIKSEYEDHKGMIFGILEAYDGNIWFGALDGCIFMMEILFLTLKVKKVRSDLYNRQF